MSLSSRNDQVARLLAAQPDALEPGLSLLDTQLELTEGVSLDMLLADGLGAPVIVLFCEREVSPVLARVAAIAEGLRTARPLLKRLYRGEGLDPALSPRFALLAPRFADDTPRTLQLMSAHELGAWEYRVVRATDGSSLLDLALFARSTPPAPVSAADAAAPLSRHLGHDLESVKPGLGAEALTRETVAEPQVHQNGHAASEASSNGHTEASAIDELADAPGSPASKDLFRRARESIRALSGEVRESGRAGRREFRVEASPLAELRLGDDGLHLRVGDRDDEQAVADEESFNAGLNAVFTHYFSRIAQHP